MGIFDKLGQTFSSSKEMNIEDYMNATELENVDLLHEPADMYVRPASIASEDDVRAIQEEISKKNIILLDITELNKRPKTRDSVIASLKGFVEKINGDIAQIDQTRILITPAKVKIVKRRKA
ncbi:MAG: cell division protein SepF [Candidatus Micrarchaeota archaeon]|nr:cell division protein SepF [Candidatus Micrarchaeota archaeon]MDE1859726.1 cell division protein SepF [Candidatus Micrarchaeota archaeon]